MTLIPIGTRVLGRYSQRHGTVVRHSSDGCDNVVEWDNGNPATSLRNAALTILPAIPVGTRVHANLSGRDGTVIGADVSSPKDRVIVTWDAPNEGTREAVGVSWVTIIPTLKVGDLVVYNTPPGVHNGSMGWDGKTARITKIEGREFAAIEFLDANIRSGSASIDRLTKKEEPMPKTIDTTKPLFIDRSAAGVKATFVTMTSDGHILVTPAPNSPLKSDWYIFDTYGVFVRSSSGVNASVLTLTNPPERKIRYVVPGYGTFSTLPTGYSGRVVLSVVEEDGRVIDCTIVREGSL